MPIMFAIYFLESSVLQLSTRKVELTVCLVMDKQIIALSSVFGLSTETGLAGEDYSLVGSAF